MAQKLIYRLYSVLLLFGLRMTAQPIGRIMDEQRLRAAGLIPVSSSAASSTLEDDSLGNVLIDPHHHHHHRQFPQSKRSVSRYMNPSFDQSDPPDHGRFVHTFGSGTENQDYQDRPVPQGRIKLPFRETDATSHYPRSPSLESSPSPVAADFLNSLDEQSLLDNELYDAPAHQPLRMESFDSVEPSTYHMQRVNPVYGVPYRRLYN